MLNTERVIHPFKKFQDVSLIAAQIVESGMATDPCIVFEFDPVDNTLWLDCFQYALLYHTERLNMANSARQVYEHQSGVELFEQLTASWTHVRSVELPQNVTYHAGLTYPSAYLIFHGASRYQQHLWAHGAHTECLTMREYVRKMEEHEFSPLLTRMVSNIYFSRTPKQMSKR